jgi:rhodanese-related sulfurtransferase
MVRKTYKSMVAELSGVVEEIFPWDLVDEMHAGEPPLLLDIRCPDEFAQAHIRDSINVPRGILESAADYGYEETVPELVEARDRRVLVICRSGNRSVLAAYTLTQMGFRNVVSLRTGLRGWNDDEQPLYSAAGALLDPDRVEELIRSRVSAAQLGPAGATARQAASA